MYQKDGWSCGLWATRYIERSLRERRGEGRLPPASVHDMVVRSNEFIDKIKAAGKNELEVDKDGEAQVQATMVDAPTRETERDM